MHADGFLLLPTAWLLTAGKPTLLNEARSDPLARRASFAYIAFILSIAVGQAFIWDSVGAQIGIWEFNPAKCTGLGTATLLPLEEVLWLFHHVVKAALWQLKMSEWRLTMATDGSPAPMAPAVRAAGNVVLAASFVAGVAALLGEADSAKCLGLIAAFFAPVFAVIWNLGSRYWRSHWRLFVSGWLPPGAWTVAIDCVGQQQGVWYFPSNYLTGIATLPDDLLKLDIAAVYLVSTFAVTATGAIILAASEEYASARGAAANVTVAAMSTGAATDEPAFDSRTPPEPTLWDLGLFIFGGASPQLAAKLATLLPSTAPSYELLYSDYATGAPPAGASLAGKQTSAR